MTHDQTPPAPVEVTREDYDRAIEVFNDILCDMGNYVEFGAPHYKHEVLETIASHCARHRSDEGRGEVSDTFDWADLLIDVICKRIEEGDPAAAVYLRTRIEAAFVPVDHHAAVISDHDELLQCEIARAEAAEAECLEQARLVGMSGERELALRAELARVKRTAALSDLIAGDADLIDGGK